jgi:plastocyanin
MQADSLRLNYARLRRGGSVLGGVLWVAAVVVTAAAAAPVTGSDVNVVVRTVSGRPVADAAVVLEPVAAVASTHRHEKAAARMEQHNRQFIPEVLVVETGTMVEFPNTDTVSHQVYSFSPARHFQLSMYRGSAHPPIEFGKAGLVVLGCNIHDEMVGYVLVTDSPYFGKTDAKGALHLAGVAPGAYTARLWGSRIADEGPTLVRRIEVADSAATEVSFALTKPLLAAPTPRPGRSEWDAY